MKTQFGTPLSRLLRGGVVLCAMALLISLTANFARAVTSYPALDIRAQISRVDHVVDAEIADVQPLGKSESNQPMGSCGMLYRIRVLERWEKSS